MILRKLLGATIRMIYKEYGLETRYITPTSVKKLMTGNGKASKEEVAEHIRTNYRDIGSYSDKAGKNKTSDIYDAIGIAVSVGNQIKEERGISC